MLQSESSTHGGGFTARQQAWAGGLRILTGSRATAPGALSRPTKYLSTISHDFPPGGL